VNALVQGRLRALGALEPGWLGDGEGAVPVPGALAQAERVLEDLLARPGVAAPNLYLTPEGLVQAEWPDCQAVFDGAHIDGWACLDGDYLAEDPDVTVDGLATWLAECRPLGVTSAPLRGG
jgi:hypothetical protein